MCTVTFIPNKKGFTLTSSRDEKNYRPTLFPSWYSHKNSRLLYPKDEIANGSWIAASDSGRMACLLNGGFVNHNKNNLGYRKSRGLVLIESFDFAIPDFLENFNLQDIEPFTLLLIDSKNRLFNELVWDGSKKNIRKIDMSTHHIWSSATLYDEEIRTNRKSWFNQWMSSNSLANNEEIFDFHQFTHTDDDTNNILMNREDGTQTVSLSQYIFELNKAQFIYKDLITSSIFKELVY
jgi:uncharacterized protein with NRDE domain